MSLSFSVLFLFSFYFILCSFWVGFFLIFYFPYFFGWLKSRFPFLYFFLPGFILGSSYWLQYVNEIFRFSLYLYFFLVFCFPSYLFWSVSFLCLYIFLFVRPLFLFVFLCLCWCFSPSWTFKYTYSGFCLFVNKQGNNNRPLYIVDNEHRYNNDRVWVSFKVNW